MMIIINIAREVTRSKDIKCKVKVALKRVTRKLKFK